MQPRRRQDRLNAGRWQVQQERAAIPADVQPPPPERTELIGTALPDILREVGVADAFWQDKLRKEWPELVGPAVASHSRPGPLQNGSLVVYVQNSVWLQEIKRVGYTPMLERLRERYGTGRIRHLRLTLDPEPGRRSDASPGR